MADRQTDKSVLSNITQDQKAYRKIIMAVFEKKRKNTTKSKEKAGFSEENKESKYKCF